MPNSKSAMKRVRIAQKRTVANKGKKSQLRTTVKKARIALETPSTDTAAVVREAQVGLDKAAAKGLMHKKTAARRKSRLAKAANKAE